MALIKCPECGKEVSNKAESCINCGYPIRGIEDEIKSEAEVEKTELKDSEQEQVEEQKQVEEQNIPEKEQKKEEEKQDFLKEEQVVFSNQAVSKRFNKKFLFGGIAAVCILIIAACGVFFKGNSGGLRAEAPIVLVNEDGTAFIQDGKKLIEIRGDAVSGEVSRDGNNIVILEKDGTLCTYNKNGKNKELVAENVSYISVIRDKGMIYEIEQGAETTVDDILEAIVDDYSEYTTFDRVKEVFESTYSSKTVATAKAMYYSVIGEFYEDEAISQEAYRYIFKTKKADRLGDVEYKIAPYTLNIIFNDSESVYVWNESEKIPVKVFSYEGDEAVELLGTSDRGKLAAWIQIVDGMSSIFVLEKNEKIKIGEFDEAERTEYGVSTVAFVNNGTEMIFWRTDSEKIFRKKVGKDPQTISAGGEVAGWGVYCLQDDVLADESIKVEELYVQVESEDEPESLNLYCVQENGDREKLLANVKSIEGISHGKVFYLNEDNSLYSADLGKREVQQETKIASEVDTASCSFDGSTLYFKKDYTAEEYTLYAVKTKDKNPEPEKVASEVSTHYLSDDGDTVVYIAQSTDIKDTYLRRGELYVKHMGKDAKKVSSDVIKVFPNKLHFIINEESLSFFKYDSVNNNDKIIVNYVIYDGNNTNTVEKNLMYSRY